VIERLHSGATSGRSLCDIDIRFEDSDGCIPTSQFLNSLKNQVPLLEQYAEVTVLFCTFDKAAVERFDPESFFTELDDIYAIFDKIVEQ